MNLSRHKEKFPSEIAEYFDSHWEKHELWKLNPPRSVLPISTLEWHLDFPFWSVKPPGPVFDLTPRAVLDNPQKHPRHWARIVAADLSFPVDVGRFGGQLVILDGLHRLAKAAHSGVTEMECRIVPKQHIRVATCRSKGAPLSPAAHPGR